MGDEEERRELSEGLKEVELLSPCSTERELGLSSKACTTDTGTFSSPPQDSICQHLLKIIIKVAEKVQAIKPLITETVKPSNCCQGSELDAKFGPCFNREHWVPVSLRLPSCF